MSILVITTGGTIGAMPYNPRFPPKFKTMPEGKDLVCDTIADRFAQIPCRCQPIEHRDSQLIDEAYRSNLAKIIDEAPEKQILVTHGTDTILETANFLYAEAAAGAPLKDKVVILTGAMLPLANGPESDGYLNVEYALGELNSGTMKPGIFIVLCDYRDPEKRQGWQPRLYPFAPGRYSKFYDPKDDSRSRIVAVDAGISGS